MLCYALENIKDGKDRRVRYLLPLKWLYEFCIEKEIGDIECLEIAQIQGLETIVAGKVVNVKNSMQIVDNSRQNIICEWTGNSLACECLVSGTVQFCTGTNQSEQSCVSIYIL